VVDKDGSWEIIDQHRRTLADLLAGLSPEQWAARSLCDAWTVRDVAAHLSQAASTSLGEVLNWLVRSRGDFDRMIRDSAIARARRPTDLIVADLRGIVGSRKLAPTTFWRDPLLDVIVHAQDIPGPWGLPCPHRWSRPVRRPSGRGSGGSRSSPHGGFAGCAWWPTTSTGRAGTGSSCTARSSRCCSFRPGGWPAWMTSTDPDLQSRGAVSVERDRWLRRSR